MWGEAHGRPDDCLGESCPHYLAPEDAAHALAEHAELERLRKVLAMVPPTDVAIAETILDAPVPEGWQLVRWERSTGDWGGGTVTYLGLHHGAWEVDPEEPWAAVPDYTLSLDGRWVYRGDIPWTPCTPEQFECLADAIAWATARPIPT